MKFATHFHIPLRVNFNIFGDTLTSTSAIIKILICLLLWFMTKYLQN